MPYWHCTTASNGSHESGRFAFPVDGVYSRKTLREAAMGTKARSVVALFVIILSGCAYRSGYARLGGDYYEGARSSPYRSSRYEYSSRDGWLGYDREFRSEVRRIDGPDRYIWYDDEYGYRAPEGRARHPYGGRDRYGRRPPHRDRWDGRHNRGGRAPGRNTGHESLPKPAWSLHGSPAASPPWYPGASTEQAVPEPTRR
jgi:hypothetical protein